jgi:hypothetical protein
VIAAWAASSVIAAEDVAGAGCFGRIADADADPAGAQSSERVAGVRSSRAAGSVAPPIGSVAGVA